MSSFALTPADLAKEAADRLLRAGQTAVQFTSKMAGKVAAPAFRGALNTAVFAEAFLYNIVKGPLTTIPFVGAIGRPVFNVLDNVRDRSFSLIAAPFKPMPSGAARAKHIGKSAMLLGHAMTFQAVRTFGTELPLVKWVGKPLDKLGVNAAFATKSGYRQAKLVSGKVRSWNAARTAAAPTPTAAPTTPTATPTAPTPTPTPTPTAAQTQQQATPTVSATHSGPAHSQTQATPISVPTQRRSPRGPRQVFSMEEGIALTATKSGYEQIVRMSEQLKSTKHVERKALANHTFAVLKGQLGEVTLNTLVGGDLATVIDKMPGNGPWTPKQRDALAAMGMLNARLAKSAGKIDAPVAAAAATLRQLIPNSREARADISALSTVMDVAEVGYLSGANKAFSEGNLAAQRANFARPTPTASQQQSSARSQTRTAGATI